ncbi:unnamed protein product [Diatraea saccharalis]|uniref:MADF domain-containing protein n=1 Tax=Diatraea saccharalis TaxID=40085 RepID=A0A9N9R7M0_9NEOP|nr:unnamed protein product [Diatraea saccharalis]
MSDISFFNPPDLIDEVKRRPALYKTDQPVDREEKLALWKEVGAAIYSDWDSYNKATAYDKVLQLQRKWRSLRDAYNRELRARKTGDRERKRVYKYFKRMSFLGGFTGSVSEEDEQETVECKSNPDDTMILTERENTPETPKLKKPRKSKRKRRSTDSIPAPEEMEMPMFSLETINDGDDSDKLFMLSFVPEMRQLPGHLKMWVRAQIANAMQEAVSCHYNDTQPTNTLEKNGLDVKRQRYESED